MKNKKTLAYKKEMSGEDTLTGKSKYAQKIRSQKGGNYSPNSPFSNRDNPVTDISEITKDLVFVRGINFFTPIDED